MPKKKLKHQFIKSLKKPEKPISYYDEIQSGLILRVSKAGTKSFSYRYRFHGKNRRFKIGTFPAVSLKQARDKIHELKTDLQNGIDPQRQRAERKNAPEPKTFEELANAFKQNHIKRKLKPSTQKTYSERIEQEMLPFFKGRYVKDINRTDIIELLEEIAFERESPYQSNRVRAILSSMFSFAVQRGMTEYNPVKTIQPLGKEEKRDRFLYEDEIQRLWQTFDSLRQPSRSLFKILLLLGQRKGETSRMKWDDISGDVWTIPKEQTKANREHEVPLPAFALSIINSMDRNSQYVFPSMYDAKKPAQSVTTAFKTAVKRAEIDNIRIHDLRRTAATHLAALGTDRTVLGKVLNHKGLAGDSQVTARYDRHSYIQRKRQALNRWSHKLQKIIEGKETKIHQIG